MTASKSLPLVRLSSPSVNRRGSSRAPSPLATPRPSRVHGRNCPTSTCRYRSAMPSSYSRVSIATPAGETSPLKSAHASATVWSGQPRRLDASFTTTTSKRLKQLLAEYPALLSWRAHDGDGGLLGFATGAYGDAGDAQREKWFTRGACAELLIDAGAVVMPSICEGLLRSRARGLLELFQRKGLLPRTLKFFAALGDLDGVRAALDVNGKRSEDRQ